MERRFQHAILKEHWKNWWKQLSTLALQRTKLAQLVRISVSALIVFCKYFIFDWIRTFYYLVSGARLLANREWPCHDHVYLCPAVSRWHIWEVQLSVSRRSQGLKDKKTPKKKKGLPKTSKKRTLRARLFANGLCYLTCHDQVAFMRCAPLS